MRLANHLTSRYPVNAGSTEAITIKNLASPVCEASALTTTPQGRKNSRSHGLEKGCLSAFMETSRYELFYFVCHRYALFYSVCHDKEDPMQNYFISQSDYYPWHLHTDRSVIGILILSACSAHRQATAFYGCGTFLCSHTSASSTEVQILEPFYFEVIPCDIL